SAFRPGSLLCHLPLRVNRRNWGLGASWATLIVACRSHGVGTGPIRGSRLSKRSAASRALVAIKIDIAVIGAGQAGLSAAYHLRRLGFEADKDFVIFDRSPGPGGAWQF